MMDYAANAFQAASASNSSAAGVNWEPFISPTRCEERDRIAQIGRNAVHQHRDGSLFSLVEISP
jgi:hypothetical protein